MSGEQLVRDTVGLLWGGDDRRIQELVDPGYRDHSARGPARGPEGFREERGALRRAFADVGMALRDVIVHEDHAAARVRVRGLHIGRWAGVEPCGRSLEWDEIHIWRLRAGRLVEHWACRDDLAALRRLGAVIHQERSRP